MKAKAEWPVSDSWPWKEALTCWGEQQKVKLMVVGGNVQKIRFGSIEIKVFEAPRRQCRRYTMGTHKRDFTWAYRQ